MEECTQESGRDDTPQDSNIILSIDAKAIDLIKAEFAKIKKLSRQRKIISFGIIAIAVIVAFVLCNPNWDFDTYELCIFFTIYIGVLISVFVVLLTIFSHAISGAYIGANNIYAEKVVKECLSSVFEDLQYDRCNCITESDVLSSNIFNLKSCKDFFISGNDYSTGFYKGISVTQSDLWIINGESTYTTIFNGKWMIFDFNKQFKSNLVLKEKYCSRSKNVGFSKSDIIEFENVWFNEKFTAYTSNKHDACYIMTPQMMRRFLKLEETHPGEVGVSFENNRLHIAINNCGESYELPFDLNFNLDEAIASIYNDISNVLSIVDLLRLDDRIFIQ